MRPLARRLTTPAAGAALALALFATASGCRESVTARGRASYPGAEVVDVGRVTFDDGDTFLVDGKPIRVLGIDTPEVREPDVGIYQDQPYGPQAADSTRAWMTDARVIEIAYDGRDRYGRRLAHVFVDGELLATRLLAAALAYENVSHFGDNGFPDLADRILRAALDAPKPPFEPPHLWRRKHQKKSN